MSSRKSEKERLREEREAREREAAAKGQRKRRLGILGAAALAAIAVVAVAVAISSSGGSSGGGSASAGTTNRLFAGIPQQGVVLGNPKAPVTLTEFADLQCPICREYTLDALPELVKRYVRPGRVRMVFRNISILGPDSQTAAQAVAAAGLQNRLWQYADRFYQEQGAENSGYVTDDFLTEVAKAVPGLDSGKLLADRDSAAVARQLRTAGRVADAAGVTGTPSFLLGRTGTRGEPLEPSSLTPSGFTGPIDAALAGG